MRTIPYFDQILKRENKLILESTQKLHSLISSSSHTLINSYSCKYEYTVIMTIKKVWFD